jgi:hypothetical protein
MANYQSLHSDMLGSSDQNFSGDEDDSHDKLAANCIKLMSASLKEDICEVRSPGTLVVDIDRNRVAQYLSEELQYACLYWIQHLQKSRIQLNDDGHVQKFLEKHLLHWLEALSWMRKMLDGIQAIIVLEYVTAVSRWSSGE